MRSDFGRALTALAASGRRPPDPASCSKASQVAIGVTSGLRVRWELAFVTVDNFNAHFQVPPSSLPGIRIAELAGINGEPVAGVLLQLPADDSWPADLPFSTVEVFTETKYFHVDYMHDRTDLHQQHGENIFKYLLGNKIAQLPHETQSAKHITNALCIGQIQQKVDKLAEEREEAAKVLQAGGDETAAPVRFTASRLQTAMAPTAQPPASGSGKKRMVVKSTPPAKRSALATPGPSRPTSRESTRSTLTSPQNPTAKGRPGVLSIDPCGPVPFTPPALLRKQGIEASIQAGSVSGESLSAASTADTVVKLGGVRGLSKVVSIDDILNGYCAGRELFAASLGVQKHACNIERDWGVRSAPGHLRLCRRPPPPPTETRLW